MGGSSNPITRTITAIATGGISEVARAGQKALTPKIPNVPVDDSAEKARLGLIAAQNAVQSKEAEARRSRASKRVSSALTGGLGLPGTAPVGTATLQSAEARKSVLG